MRQSPRLTASYAVCTLASIALGLTSRQYGAHLPAFVAAYAGDTLWALMVFLAFSALAPRTRVTRRGAAALTFAVAIEVSQLYHAPWIDGLRDTTLGGLVLGFGFLWSDLACYAAGVASGMVLAWLIRSWLLAPTGEKNPPS